MKRSMILTDRLGPDILSAFWRFGCEGIAPVSGSFCSILKLLRMMAFTGLL